MYTVQYNTIRWRPSWISEQNGFSNSESLYLSDASYQIRLNTSYGLGADMVEEFQDGRHLGYRNKTVLAILNLCRADASYKISAQSNLRFGRRCVLKNFKMAAEVAIFDIRTERF